MKTPAGADLTFEALQEDVLGFVQYKVRGTKDEWYIDAYSRLGRYIKCKIGRQPEEVVREWVNKYSSVLKEMIV